MNFRGLILLFVLSAETFGQDLPDSLMVHTSEFGKMWTFDAVPYGYLEKTYRFRPSEQWLDNAMHSTLVLDDICSASFVSPNGLVMTNHHCSLNYLEKTRRAGEDPDKNGFYAHAIADERKAEGLYVKQLISVEDITEKIKAVMESGASFEEKIKIRERTIKEVQEEKADKTRLLCKVYSFFNGAKYFLYCFKVYDDVRVVFAPELQIGYFGGDEDNFTYPRYDLDIAFYRVYENDKPMKTENYFRWSTQGAKDGEDIYMIGYPGRTNRLRTVSQLEYNRDILYPAFILNGRLLSEYLKKFIVSHPKKKSLVEATIFAVENFLKATEGYRKGLSDTAFFNKKISLEKKLRALVESNPALKNKYSGIWDAISEARNEFRKYVKELVALALGGIGISSDYFLAAKKIVALAGENKLDVSSDSLVDSIFPENFDADLAGVLLEFQIDVLKSAVNDSIPSAENMLSGSLLTDREKIKKLLKAGADAVLNSDDPILRFVQFAEKRSDSINALLASLKSSEDYNRQLLGELFYGIYGNTVSPDANSTLRISDGVIKPYYYNGTIAPAFTTFYGMYDRYYSFGKSSSWDLPERWLKPQQEFNLNTPLCFCATSDGIGGNSGSAVINKKGDVVGIFFDLNMGALANDFIFSETAGRSVFVDSRGIIQSLKHIYKAGRLVNELLTEE